MAEIIRRGELPDNIWYEHTCGNCATRFKFQKRELSAGSGSSFHIACPLCSKACYMTTTSLKRYTQTSSYVGGGWGPYDR